MLLSIASLTCGSQNQKPPRSHIGCELGQFGAGKLAEPGQLDPEGALMFSVLPETGIWIRHCASSQKTGSLADGVAGRRLSC